MSEELKHAGAQLANVAFNLAQKPGHALTSDDVVLLDKLRREWDAACRALSAQPPQCPHGGGQCGVGGYCEPCPNAGGTSQPPAPSVLSGWPVAHLWQHGETGRTRVVMPDQIVTADANWFVVGPLYLAAAPPPVRERLTYTEDQVADACMAAEIPDSKCESLLIALRATGEAQ